MHRMTWQSRSLSFVNGLCTRGSFCDCTDDLFRISGLQVLRMLPCHHVELSGFRDPDMTFISYSLQLVTAMVGVTYSRVSLC
jgi:hypothetical protein